MDDNEITDEECIDFYRNNMLEAYNSCMEHYDLIGYDFNGIPIDIVIHFDIEKEEDYDNFDFFINCYVYDTQSLINGVLFQRSTILFTKEFNDANVEDILTDILNFLLHTFRKEFVYSKIADEIVHLDFKNEAEKKRMARLKLIENRKLEQCCVCFENNILYTKCDHNLCRKCSTEIINKHSGNSTCPLCRESL